jgi:hypothetical protein
MSRYRRKILRRNGASPWPAHLSLHCEVVPKEGGCDLRTNTSCARCASCGERYHSRARAGEHHRCIRREFRPGRWRVPRHGAVERRADCPVTLRSRQPAAGHRECANCRLRPGRILRHGGASDARDTVLLEQHVFGLNRKVQPKHMKWLTKIKAGAFIAKMNASGRAAAKNVSGQGYILLKDNYVKRSSRLEPSAFRGSRQGAAKRR